jgi:hypothetical protein
MREAPMFSIEFTGPLREGGGCEVIDRMTSDLTKLDEAVTHAKSLFSNVILQRVHKAIPRGFRILNPDGIELARWSIDDA